MCPASGRNQLVDVHSPDVFIFRVQVRVLGACLGDPTTACIIMELVEGGDLASRIHRPCTRRLTYFQILQVPPAAARSPCYVVACRRLTAHDNTRSFDPDPTRDLQSSLERQLLCVLVA